MFGLYLGDDDLFLGANLSKNGNHLNEALAKPETQIP